MTPTGRALYHVLVDDQPCQGPARVDPAHADLDLRSETRARAERPRPGVHRAAEHRRSLGVLRHDAVRVVQ